MGTRLVDLCGINYVQDSLLSEPKSFPTTLVQARLLQADTRDALLKDKLGRKSLLPSDGSLYGILCIDPPWGENKHKGKVDLISYLHKVLCTLSRPIPLCASPSSVPERGHSFSCPLE